jgi:signal transduction histidine kinase
MAVAGTAEPLPAAVELAAYRVVQESLTNALRYAGGTPTSVALCYLDDGLDLVVENDAPAAGRRGPAAGAAGERPLAGGTRGLQGLAERAELLGGSLRAGPRPGGGFRVHAWLPVKQ